MVRPEVYHRKWTPHARIRVRAVAAMLLALGATAVPAPEVDASLWSRLQRIEKAFLDNDAQALRSSMTREGKVRVDVDGLTEGSASYGPGQLEVVFARLFRERPTYSFDLRRADVTVSDGRTAFARARWGRRDPATRSLETDTLTFTLRRQGRDWRVHEVLSSR